MGRTDITAGNIFENPMNKLEIIMTVTFLWFHRGS
jgi:hypothetical protein